MFVVKPYAFSKLPSVLFRLLAAVVGFAGMQIAQADEPEYFLSSRYHYFGDTYIDVSDNRTLTKIGRERDWDNGGKYTGNLYRSRTTGGFSSTGVAEVTTMTIPGFTDDYSILRFVGDNIPVTEAGDLMMMIGKKDTIGNPTVTSAVIWKADNNVVIANPNNGGTQLWPKDMNESLVGCGYLRVKYTDKFDRERLRDVPVLISPSGVVTVIQPSRVDSYGYEFNAEDSSWDPPTKDNQFRAMAINNQGAVVCNGHAIFTSESGRRSWEYYSFVSQNGAITVANLPAGGSDINDLGEVVGVNGNGTWLYRPGSGVTYIDSVEYLDGYDGADAKSDSYRYLNLDTQAVINNKSEVTWLWINYANFGGQDYPKRLWKDGAAYNLTDLYETEEDFTLDSVVDLNENGDFLVGTKYPVVFEGQTFSSRANRIVSTRPFSTELIVNVTDDLSDADPNDEVVDIDLDKAGLQVSLRAAIEAVNAGDSSTIKFDIPGDAVPVIILIKALPGITQPVTIDGTTQSAGKVEVRGGAFAGAGFHLQGGSSEVKGMVLNGFNGKDSAAIRISGAGGNRIITNWLGTNADGSALRQTQFGVLIEGTSKNTIGGEASGEGNTIYGETAGIALRGAGTDDTTILGNRIGISSSNTIFTPLVNNGILQTAGSGTTIGNTGSGGNVIAASVGVNLQSQDGILDNIKVTGNSIGLDGNGTSAGEASYGILFAGGDEHEFKKLEVESNKIAGCYANVFGVDAGKFGEVVITKNDIGLRFDGTTQEISGATDSTSTYGIRLDGPLKATVTDNVVAGHVYNILLSGIINMYVFGGEDTDGDGEPDANFSVSVLNPDDGELPEQGDPVAEDCVIKNNYIGLNRLYQVPEWKTKQQVGLANFGGAKKTEIEGNTIGGQETVGIWIESGIELSARSNRVGVTPSGIAKPNGTGLRLDFTSIKLQGNTVAHNTVAGYVITDSDEGNEVLIQGGSVYLNGNGGRTVGIAYEDAPFEPIDEFFILKSSADKVTGMIDVTFALAEVADDLGLEETTAMTTLEIWGNPSDEQTQGRTLLLSREIDPSEDFSYTTQVKATSPFATSSNYTATLTYGPQTSGYSQAFKPVRFDWPELNFAPTEGGGITVGENELVLQWPVVGDPDLFFVVEASSLNGPWHKAAADTRTEDGTTQATIPLSETGEQFFRLGINPSALKDLATDSLTSLQLNQSHEITLEWR